MQFPYKNSDTKQLKRRANLRTIRIFLKAVTLKIVPNSALKRRKCLHFFRKRIKMYFCTPLLAKKCTCDHCVYVIIRF